MRDGKTLVTVVNRVRSNGGVWIRPPAKPPSTLIVGWSKAVISPEDQLLASGGSDGVLRLWSLKERTPSGETAAHKNTIYGLCFSPDGRKLASASFDRSIKIWQIQPEAP